MEANSTSSLPGVSDLVEKYWRRVYKLCFFYLRDPQDAEEATQQAFEIILKKHSQFQGQSDPYTWIYRITVNTALDLLRRRKIIRWLSLEQAHEPGTAADPAVEMERSQDEQEKLRRLQAGIARMSAREKKAFYLFHYEQLPQKEIAAIMGVSVPAVESLVHKAVKKIRAL